MVKVHTGPLEPTMADRAKKVDSMEGCIDQGSVSRYRAVPRDPISLLLAFLPECLDGFLTDRWAHSVRPHGGGLYINSTH